MIERAPEAGYLEILFAELNAAAICYAVMRNHEPLPYSAGGSDLDLMILGADETRVRALVKDAIALAGGVPIGLAESVGFFKVYVLGKSADGAGPWWGLRLDFNVGLFFRGSRLLDETVAWPLVDYRGIPVLAQGFAGVLGVLKEILNNGTYPARYALAAQDAAANDWPQIECLLAPMGPEALAQLRQMCHAGKAADVSVDDCTALRQAVFRHANSQRGVLAIRDRVAYEWSKMRRYIKPSGFVLAILGVDGAGKSTVINAILPALNAATHNAVHVQHLRPSILPPLARLKGGKKQPVGPVLEPHGSTPSGTPGSLFRLAYLTLDYIVGYWLWTRPKIAKQPTVVIFDRYAYDMALDPRRFRIGLPGRVAGWFAALAPKPDLIICLHGTPTIIAARKLELPVEETRRQVEALHAFARNEPRAVLVSTDTPIEETRDQVLQTVCQFLRKKAENGR